MKGKEKGSKGSDREGKEGGKAEGREGKGERVQVEDGVEVSHFQSVFKLELI